MTSRNKYLLIRTLATAAALALTACGGGEGGGGGGGGSPIGNSPEVAQYVEKLRSSGITIPREVGEERVMVYKDPETGETITVRGERDSEAMVQSVTRIESISVDKKTNSVIFLENGNRQYELDNGVQLELSRTESGVWLASFYDLETGISFKTNLAQPVTGGTKISPSRLTRSQSESHTNVMKASPTNAAKIPVTVKTSNCGKPADMLGNVDLILRSGVGDFLGKYNTEKIGVGTYQGFVPDTANKYQVSLTTVKNAVQTTAQVLGQACGLDAAQPLAATQACNIISTTIASTAIGLPVAAKFFAACHAAVAAGKLACRINGVLNPSLPVPDYVDPVASDILPTLNGILINALPDSILDGTVTPTVVALPASINGASVPLNGKQGIVATIDRADLVVGHPVLTPSAPPAGVGYSAAANLQCIAAGSAATLSVLGSDSYTDSTSKLYNAVTAEDRLSLSVPGATSSVRDTVTLTVTQTLGRPTVTRTSYLVFQ